MARLRVALLEETGDALSAPERQLLLRANEDFYRGTLGSQAWQSWVAEFGANGRTEVGAVGTLALWERPPYPGNPAGLDAYLLNMYTLPAYRGRGAARAIVQAVVHTARERGVGKVVLHATEAGRPIYAEAGFVASMAYMELSLGRRES